MIPLFPFKSPYDMILFWIFDENRQFGYQDLSYKSTEIL
jgi:hypothetical protein